MKLFLAVVFFCSDGQCAFWKSKELYFDQDKCGQTVAAVQQQLTKQGIESAGTCIEITTKNNI